MPVPPTAHRDSGSSDGRCQCRQAWLLGSRHPQVFESHTRRLAKRVVCIALGGTCTGYDPLTLRDGLHALRPQTGSAALVEYRLGCSTQYTLARDAASPLGSSPPSPAAHLEIKQGGSTVFCRNYTLDGPAIGTAC
jgi:hypothetical protein